MGRRRSGHRGHKHLIRHMVRFAVRAAIFVLSLIWAFFVGVVEGGVAAWRESRTHC